MGQSVRIAGGAGFIGSHLGEELVRAGREVRALDDRCAQVHGPTRAGPSSLHPRRELLAGHARHPGTVRDALRGLDAVVPLAAAVGVAQRTLESRRETR